MAKTFPAAVKQFFSDGVEHKPPTCTLCGAPATHKIDTGGLRALGKRDWVFICAPCRDRVKQSH